MSLDLKLLRGEFDKENLPPEYEHLIKYFQSKLSRALLFYYFDFSSLIKFKSIKYFCDNFVDHTGYCCSESRLRFLVKKLELLMTATDRAKQDFNFELLEKIVSGKFREKLSGIDFSK